MDLALEVRRDLLTEVIKVGSAIRAECGARYVSFAQKSAQLERVRDDTVCKALDCGHVGWFVECEQEIFGQSKRDIISFSFCIGNYQANCNPYNS